MTDRISSFQGSPATTFTLEADATAEPSFGTNGRWRVRCYLRANNGPGGSTGSFYGGAGTQQGRVNGSAFATHAGTPFLPSGVPNGAERWRDGPYDVYVNANSNGYWSGTSTSLPVQMALVYGAINTTPSGNVPVSRIARAPGAPGSPVVSALTPTGCTLTWTAAARGNANIDQYQWQVATDPGFTNVVKSGNLGNVLTVGVTGLTPGTDLHARVRAHNGDGYGPWTVGVPFKTLSAMYVGKGGSYPPAAAVNVGKSGTYPAAAEVRVGKSGSYVPAG